MQRKRTSATAGRQGHVCAGVIPSLFPETASAAGAPGETRRPPQRPRGGVLAATGGPEGRSRRRPPEPILGPSAWSRGPDRWWESLDAPSDDFAAADGTPGELSEADRRGLASSLILIQECKSRTEGGESLVKVLPGEELNAKIFREQMYRKTAAGIAAALPWDEMKLRGRLRECGGYMMFREWLEAGKVSLRSAVFCNRVRLCPGCAHWSAVRTVADWVPKFERLLREGDLVPLLMTFTVRDGDDLGERLQVLRNGLRLVGRRVSDARRGKGKTWFAGIVGAVARIEIKRGKNSGQWHPHAHALVLRERRERFPLAGMQAEWRELVGRGNLNVKLAYSARAIIAGQDPDPVRLHADLAEVIKYAMKFGDMAPADVVQAWKVIHGQRLAYSLGACYGMKEQAAGPDRGEFSGEWRDWSCRFNAADGRYDVALVGQGVREMADSMDAAGVVSA
jgi:hypothetical protein